MILDGKLNAKTFNNYFSSSVGRTYKQMEKAKHTKATIPYVFSMHTQFNKCDYVPIESLIKIDNPSSESLIKLVFEAVNEEQYTLILSKDQQIFTKFRGFIDADKLEKMDVFIDNTGQNCKLVSSTKIPNNFDTFYNLKAKFNNNFFYNGILIR
jgi:hypothetical protein